MIILSGVTILGATMVMWANSNLTSRETVLATAASTRANTFNEFLSIENVWHCIGGGTAEPCHPTGSSYPAINATLTNIGSIGFNVTQITLTTTVNNQLTTNVYSIKNVALTPGQYYMWAQSYPNFSSKVPITITVTTARGSIFTTQVTLQ
jgi:hypothetical protein